MPVKVYRFKCPKCGKEIVSLYERQARYNAQNHMTKHRVYLSPDEVQITEEVPG